MDAHRTQHPGLKRPIIGVGLIISVVVLLHGPSVRYGLLGDDYNHRAELREGEWSFRSLVMASHLGSQTRRVRMWWQEEADLYFFRPVAFFLMKLEYLIGGWRPAAMHAFSLVWTVICATLVLLLARSALGDTWWPALGGVLFVIHPANGYTGRWIASQNQQMATAFLLGGLLCYGCYARWWRGHDARERHRKRAGCLLGALVCFAAALGCRENSVVFAAVVIAGDWVVRPDRAKGRWHVHAILIALMLLYLLARYLTLGGWSMPGLPCAYPLAAPGFTRFVFDKLIYYLLGLFAYFPIVMEFDALGMLRSYPLWFYGAFAILVLLWAVLLWRFRQGRTVWLWLLLALIPLAPVLPLFPLSHHLYLASAGMAIAAVTMGQWIWGWALQRHRRARKVVHVGVVVLIVLQALAFTGVNVLYDLGLAGFSAASQLPVKEVKLLARPLQAGDRLFFVNLPWVGFNCIPGIEEAISVSSLRGYVLTFSPAFLRMDRHGYVKRVGPRQLRVWLDQDGYFSGPLGRTVLQAVSRTTPFQTGDTFTTPDFRVEVVRASESGIREFLFTFERPLDDPTYHFFFGSRGFSAYPLRFGPADSGSEEAGSQTDTVVPLSGTLSTRICP